MRTLIVIVVLFTGSFFLHSDGEEAEALALLDANNPALERQQGRLMIGDLPVSGVVVDEGPEGTTWTMYVDGYRDGREVSRYPNAAPKMDRMWANGKRNGLLRSWWPDGSLKEVSDYQDDVIEGESRKWFADGQQASIFHYTAGQENGNQMMWYEDGTIRANYVVKEGRRYGSNGTKGCTSEEKVNE